MSGDRSAPVAVAGAPTWTSAPSVRSTSDRTALAVVAIGGWIALVGPVARAARLPASSPVQLALVGAVAAVLVLVVPTWWARLAVAAAAGAVVHPTQGSQITVLLCAGLVLAPWVARGRPPLPGLRAPDRGVTPPVVVLCGVAAWVGSRPESTWQGFVPLAVAFVLTAVPFPGRDRFLRLATRAGDVAASVTSAILFELLACLLVVMPWAFQRALAVDALAGTGWFTRDRRPLQPGRLWAPEPVTGPRGPRRRQWVLACVVVSALVVGVVLWRRSDDTSPASGDLIASSDDRSGGAGWHQQYREDITWILNEKVAFRPFEVYRLLDAETRTVNIHHGYRDSYRAPECGCRRVTVWLYGGSGAFGLEQRDAHTIASELARVARRDGIVVDVANRGIPGQMHWRSSLRFAWDLTTQKRPDLVLFYGGAEEIDSALELAKKGLGDIRAPFEPLSENLYDEIEGNTGNVPDPPRGAAFLGWPLRPGVSDTAVDDAGVLAVGRFERSLQLSDDTAATAKVPVRYYWQPLRGARGSAATPPDATAADRRQAAAFRSASRTLGSKVTDLSRVVDRRDFTDATNVDERGARVVAEAMYRDLRSQLRRLSDTPDR